MIAEKILSAILIIVMIWLVGVLTKEAASVRYRGLDLWLITVKGVFKREKDFKCWLKKNYDYWLNGIVSFCLCITILALLENFLDGRILERPRVVIMLSSFIYAGIALILVHLYKTRKRNKQQI